MVRHPAEKIIPEHKEGKETNIEEDIVAHDEETAKMIFNRAKQRLLNVNNWKEISGNISAIFSLTDPNGNEVQREAREGDYFKIDIPGPGTKKGEGYDWVRVEAIEDHSSSSASSESFGIRVRPADKPQTQPNSKEGSAHFFTEEATSNFLIKREGRKVIASVHGRNEKPNPEGENIFDKIRNVVTGATAVAGLSKVQWKKLVKGLISEE